MSEEYDQGAILKLLKDSFSNEELNTMTFDLFNNNYQDYSELHGDAKRRAIISYAFQQGRISEVLDYIAEKNPFRYRLYIKTHPRPSTTPATSEHGPGQARPSGLGSARITPQEIDHTITILAKLANNAPIFIGPKGYLQNMVQSTDWPRSWRSQRGNALTGIADVDARALIDYAIDQGGNPDNPGSTIIGGLLVVMLDDSGAEDRNFLQSIIEKYGLSQNE